MILLRLTLITMICFGLISFGLCAGHSSLVKKNLPLDAMPNIQMKTPENSHYLSNKIIIRLQAGQQGFGKQTTTMSASVNTMLAKYSPKSVEHLFQEVTAGVKPMDLSKFYVMTFTAPLDPFTVSKEISQHPDVLYAEPWFIYPVDGITTCTPNDSLRYLQWALTKIRADSAYCFVEGDTTVSIGIIDTGVEWTHPDLAANIYTNQGEYGDDGQGGRKESNGIDDDGNGYVDDWHGWDFGGADYTNPFSDNNPTPTNDGAGHGTHVAGIVSARTNNTAGVAGVANNCRILPVKTGSDNDHRGPGGTPYIVFGFQGMLYAAQQGAAVINCSWGGPGASQFEQEVVDSATALGSLIVCSAGNSGTQEPNFPASYRHAFSVTATLNTDARASYASYGENVDVAAPGGLTSGLPASDILSTWFGNSYESIAGTSMAAPHAAGLAALVKSKFPSYSNIQIGEQVRVTSDTFGTLTSTYKYKLGKGRINALRAVTENIWPSIRILSYRAVDSVEGNNNGVLEPGESFALKIAFQNYLQPTSAGAAIQITTYDNTVSFQQNMFAIGAVPTMGTATNDANPYIVKISSGMPAGHVVQFILKISDGSYTDFELFSIFMNPPYATHSVNNVQATVTINGHVGFYDSPTNSQGVGFVFGGGNQLFEGGLIIGYNDTKVVDVVRNEVGMNADFTSTQIYQMITPGPIATEEGFGVCTDDGAAAANKIGLKIDTRSYAFHDSPDTNYIIVRYDITNTSGSEITNLHAGMFFDWDMLPNFETNKTSFDQSRSLAYAYDDSAQHPVYCGARALDSAVSYRALINSTTLDLSKAGKWNWLTGGVVLRDTAADIHYAISEGPFTLANGATRRIGFAIIGGEDLADIQNNADYAKAKWPQIYNATDVKEKKNVHPTLYALRQNYPNPFNPSTVINYEIPSAGKVTLNVFNVLGQVVATLVDRDQQSGSYDVTFEAPSLPSGVYFYRLTVSSGSSGINYTDVKKLLLLR